MKKVLIILILFLSSCAYVDSIALDFNYALNAANTRRENIRDYSWPTLEEVIALSYYSNNIPLNYSYNLSNRFFHTIQYNIPRASAGSIFINNAIKDVYKFFNELRFSYVRYTLLGGDETFLPIRDKIIEEIKSTYDEKIPIRQLSNLLHLYLTDTINNWHFILGSSYVVRRYIRFSNDYYRFGRNELGYFYNLSNSYIVSKVYGHSKNDIFRIFLDSEGELFYSFFINYFRGDRQIPFSEPYKLTIIYDNGTYKDIYLKRHIVRATHNPRTFTDFSNQIPIVTSSGFMSIEEQLDFSLTAFEVREEPIIILDLRSHGGGHPEVFYLWQYIVLGDFNFLNSMNSRSGLYPRSHIRNLIIRTPNGTSPPPASFVSRIDQNINLSINGHDIRGFADVNLANIRDDKNPLLIVLVDSRTASGGEQSLISILGIDNTLVIGNDTWGVFVTHAGNFLTLPNSGIEFSNINIMPILPPELTRFEGRGIPPDVTVTSNTDVLTAVLNLLERSGRINY